jgi:hypothetical protein
MLLSFPWTVSALTYSIIRERCAPAAHGFPNNRVVRFILEQHGRMPDYLRTPLQLLTLAFDAWPLPFTGHPFHCLSHERRWRQVHAWKRSALGARRDLVRFYEGLVLFGWYAEVYDGDA